MNTTRTRARFSTLAQNRLRKQIDPNGSTHERNYVESMGNPAWDITAAPVLYLSSWLLVEQWFRKDMGGIMCLSLLDITGNVCTVPIPPNWEVI